MTHDPLCPCSSHTQPHIQHLFEKLISNLNYDNLVRRSDGVIGVITQVWPDWAMWVWSDSDGIKFYETITEKNASYFTVLGKP